MHVSTCCSGTSSHGDRLAIKADHVNGGEMADVMVSVAEERLSTFNGRCLHGPSNRSKIESMQLVIHGHHL